MKREKQGNPFRFQIERAAVAGRKS